MIRYATGPLGFWQTIKACFVAYVPLLKKIWPFVLLSSVLNIISSLALKWNAHIGYAVTVLVFLGIAFLYAVILKLGDSVLTTGVVDTKQTLQYALKRYVTLIGGYIVFIAIAAILFIIDSMLFSLGKMMGDKVYPILATIAVLMSVFIMLLLYFALPIIVLDEKNTYQSFKDSTKLGLHWWLVIVYVIVIVYRGFRDSAKLVLHHWWRTFGVLGIIHVIVIGFGAMVMELIPSQNSPAFMSWNFIYQILLYPLIIATILIVLHDLKMRKELTGK